MKIIIHLYFNDTGTLIKSLELEIESNEITVKELKKRLSDIFQIKPSEQILTIKFLGIKVITLSDDYPLSFFYIRKNSEIYLDSINKYKDKTPSEISQMNKQKNIIIPNIFDKKIKEETKNNNIFDNNKINQDTIFELLEESSDNEEENEQKMKKNDNNLMNPIKELNPEFIIKNALLLIRDNKLLELIKYLE